MMGLRFGEGGDRQDVEDELMSDAFQEKLLRGTDLSAAADDANGEDPVSVSIDEINELELDYPAEEDEVWAIFEGDDNTVRSRGGRRWTKTDRTDLTKLGNMIGSFLEEPQFAADTKLFQTHAIAPLMDPSGPRHGSIQVVTQVMQSVMIRHRFVH